ncbi:MAG: hypothetical protein CMN72_09665, partial [Sphingomonas sp.]|nr:hypothetical protein [Sphingomonas sp.]
MSFKMALHARIQADPVVTASGATVEWSRRRNYPSIVLTVVYDPRPRTMDGRQGWKPTRVYIDVMSADIAMVEALREAVLALIGFGELRDGTRFFPAQDISVTDMGEETDAG